MASDPKRSNNFCFNFDLVMGEIARWPVATLIVMALVSSMVVLIDDPRLHLTPALAALMVAGYSCAILGLKACLLLMAYPRIHKVPFPGSYLISSFLALIPIFAFYGSAFPALMASIPDEEPPPVGALILLLSFGYVLFSLFFAFALRFQHGILAISGRIDDAIRAKWDAVVGRGDNSLPDA
jgi:hypothetical protein